MSLHGGVDGGGTAHAAYGCSMTFLESWRGFGPNWLDWKGKIGNSGRVSSTNLHIYNVILQSYKISTSNTDVTLCVMGDVRQLTTERPRGKFLFWALGPRAPHLPNAAVSTVHYILFLVMPRYTCDRGNNFCFFFTFFSRAEASSGVMYGIFPIHDRASKAVW